jgi:1-acyl-sn-glycerol-3-phosphate acyltransferase
MELLDNFLEKFYRYGAKVIIKLVYRCDFRGFENIPETGGALVIANHVSFMDGLIINAASKRPIRFIIYDKIYRQPIVHHFMRINRAIPIDGNRESVRNALNAVSEGLSNGDLIVIFPEGSITYTGNMVRFKFGIEWMISKNPVPVIPVVLGGLWGSVLSRKYINSKTRWFPKTFRRKIAAICSEPIAPKKATVNYLQKKIMQIKSEYHLEK